VSDGLCAEIEVLDGCVGFLTTSPEAFRFLTGLDGMFTTRAYRFTPIADTDSHDVVVRYMDGPGWQFGYEPDRPMLTFTAPWPQVLGSTILRMCVLLGIEIARQRAGRYLFHASAVTGPRGSVVMLGGSESGKTTAALDLCLRHGAALGANDQSVLTVSNGAVEFVSGDAAFNLRYASIVRYSEALTLRLFGRSDGSKRDRHAKRLVDPSELGIKSAVPPASVRCLALIRLDSSLIRPIVEPFRGASAELRFLIRTQLYHELSGLIRGVTFVPLDQDLDYRSAYIPACDEPALVAKRMDFLRTLIESTDVIRIRDSRPRWRSERLTRDWAGVVASGVLDLVLRWPTTGVQTDVTVSGHRPPARSYHIAELATYEVGSPLGGGPALPRTVLTIGKDLAIRMDELWTAAFALSSGRVDVILGGLIQASSAAAASHPFDRVMPVWTGLELLYPGTRDLTRIDRITRTDPTFAKTEGPRGSGASRVLLRHRAELFRDPWLHTGVKRRLGQPPKGIQERVETATVAAYAIRSLIVHGRWARAREDRRNEARAAESWLWQLLEREIELRLMGSRLPPIASPGAAFSI